MLRTILSIEIGTQNTAEKFQKSDKQREEVMHLHFVNRNGDTDSPSITHAVPCPQ
jgi:hypothetical protein